MVIPIPGNVDISIVYDILLEPAIIVLLIISMGAGMLRGKMENDQAVAGNPQFAGMQNTGMKDWIEDAGMGLIGGVLGLGLILFIFPNIPIFFLPGFGYAGRMLLIKVGKTAEGTISIESKAPAPDPLYNIPK